MSSLNLVVPSNRKNFFVTSFRKNKTNATKTKKYPKYLAQQGQLTETCLKQNAEIKLGILKFIYENYNFQITIYLSVPTSYLKLHKKVSKSFYATMLLLTLLTQNKGLKT